MDDFSQKSDAFLAWFRALPGATFHESIRIEDLRHRNAGRGIVATADIEPDTVLFTIPRKSIICAPTSDVVRYLPAVFAAPPFDATEDGEADDQHEDRSQDSWTSLILIMIYEHLRGPASPWKPYLDVLPTRFETLMFWSQDELRHLQASSVLSKVGKEEADSMIRTKILPVVHEHANVFYPSGVPRLNEEDLLALAHRMGSTIMAYAFDLDKDEEEEKEDEDDEWIEDREGKTLMGMVPMADILNADAEFNAHINHEEEALTATALRPIKAGEEILNYYGPLPNSELLRRYGYTTTRHHRYDVVELSWDLVFASIKSLINLTPQEWTRIADTIEPEELEDSFILDRDLDEADSTGRFPPPTTAHPPVLTELPSEMDAQVKYFLKTVKENRPDAVPDKARRDEIYYSGLQAALAARLAEYETNADEDRAALEQAAAVLAGADRGIVNGRVRNAIEVRLGEKVLLLEAKQLVEEKLRGLTDQNGEAHTAKRQRR